MQTKKGLGVVDKNGGRGGGGIGNGGGGVGGGGSLAWWELLIS